ncbi:MAG: rhomboid family intramembrane serine protease [Spirochaetes bacterium]|nr:rhomboid family intramembrane serine protease [Spirochaetota bacterium]
MQQARVTFILIAINIVAYVFVALQGSNMLQPGGRELVKFGANFVPFTVGQLELWRLLTSVFLHGSLMHLAINMYSLYSVGSMVEFLCGRTKYLVIYLACGLAGSLASAGANLLRTRPGISIGASGAVFGIYGFFLLLMWLRKDLVHPSARRQILQSGAIFIGINLFLGFMSPGIDNAAHIGGLIAGLAAALLFVRSIRLIFPNQNADIETH